MNGIFGEDSGGGTFCQRCGDCDASQQNYYKLLKTS